VEGVIICSRDGVVLRSEGSAPRSLFPSAARERSTSFLRARAGTLAPSAAAQYAGLLTRLVAMARSTVRATADGGAAGGGDDLAFLRLRTLSREVMVVPGDEFLLVAIQAAALDDAAAA
jgi:hypothetical protein